MSQLVQMRTNTKFSLNYETNKLEPVVELIFLVSSPEYSVDTKKGQLVKGVKVIDIRIDMEPDSISRIIGELQALQNPIQSIENMAHAFNTIIVNSKPKGNE